VWGCRFPISSSPTTTRASWRCSRASARAVPSSCACPCRRRRTPRSNDMGFRLSKIYTRTGDAGQTGLSDGIRVAKDHPRIEAIGEVDTLNCVIGVLLAELLQEQREQPGLTEISEALAPCQHRLFDVGGELSMPVWEALQINEVERLEALIDRWNEEVGPLKDFILPGGSRLIALAHQARAAARTAERRCQTLNQ